MSIRLETLMEENQHRDNVFLLNGWANSWANKKQTCIALSTMKVKFVMSISAVQEVVWLTRFFQHLGIITTTNEIVTIYCYNQVTIAYTNNLKYHDKTIYIDIKYNYVKDINS